MMQVQWVLYRQFFNADSGDLVWLTRIQIQIHLPRHAYAVSFRAAVPIFKLGGASIRRNSNLESSSANK